MMNLLLEALTMKSCLTLRSTPLGMTLTVTLKMLPLQKWLILKVLPAWMWLQHSRILDILIPTRQSFAQWVATLEVGTP